MKKRILSCFLALAMALSLLPMSVLAAGGQSYDNKDTAKNETGVVAQKTAASNDDGTYRVTLSVKGNQETSTGTKNLPADIVLVVDTSTSMKDWVDWVDWKVTTRLDVAKSAAANFVSDLLSASDQIRIGLCDFSGSNRTEVSLTDDKTALINDVNGLHTPSGLGDGTDYTLGLTTAEKILETSSSDRQKYIVFLSDGEPTYGNGVDKANNLKKNDVTIMTVGVDVGHGGTRALKDISSKDSNGDYYFWKASTSGTDEDALSTILSLIQEKIESTIYSGTNAVMTDVINTDDFTLVDGTITGGASLGDDGKTLTWTIGNIGSEEKTVTFNVQPKEGHYGQLYTNENVSLEFYSTTLNEKVTFTKGAIGDPYITIDAPTYTVTYDANGGSGTMEAQTFTFGEEQALKPNSFTRNFYTFSGWATTYGGEVLYTDKQIVEDLTSTPNETITLYAVWEEQTVTINYAVANSTGGTVSSSSETVGLDTGSVNGSTATPTEGYYFAGWYNDEDCETLVDNSAVFTPPKPTSTDPVTYYALFKEKDTVTITANDETYTYNGGTQTVPTGGYTTDLPEGYTISEGVTVSGSGKDASSYPIDVQVNPDTLKIVDSNGNDVTTQFTVKTEAGTLTINKRNVTLTSGSDSKTYDGAPLTKDGVTVSEGNFVLSEGVTCTCSGSQTNVGSSQNLFTYVPNEGTSLDNYNITSAYGTLTVKGTVTYDPNANTDLVTNLPTDSNTYNLNDSVSVAEGTPIRENYTFVGWMLTSDGSNTVTNGTMGETGLTFYAKWEKKEAPTPDLDWDVSRSKTATNLDKNYESQVTLSLPSAEEELASDVVFVLDKSTSAEVETQILSMLQILNEQIENTDATIKVGVVVFNKEAHRVLELTELNSENMDAIKNAIAYEISSGTNTHAGLLAGKAMLDEDTSVDSNRKYLIFVSDGITYMYNEKPTVTAWSFWADSWNTWAGPDNWSSKYGNTNPPKDWGTWLTDIEAKVSAQGTTYEYPYGGTVSQSTPQENWQTAYANSIDKALYLTYETYQEIQEAGYQCYAVTASSNASYPWATSFMGYLSKGQTVSFEDIQKDIYYLVDAGSYVVDVIGSGTDNKGNAYNFDFVNQAGKLTLKVGEKTYSAVSIPAQDDATASYSFGDVRDGFYPYVLNYYQNGTKDVASEHFVWEINVPVSNFAHVQLTYSVKLTNPQSRAGTYGQYDADGSEEYTSLYTNTSAVLTPVDSNDVQGPKQIFAKPTVSYTIKKHDGGGTVEPPVLDTENHYGYIVGYDDGTVRPNGKITRAEVATIFFRLLTDESRDAYWCQTNDFSDVSASDWYNNAISTLTNAGILDGYEDGTFRPNGNITRAEFATIAVRFFDLTYEGEDLFPDISDHWARDYINQAAAAGFVNGYEDGTFRPNNAITRAEAVTLVNRTLERKPHKAHLLADMIQWPDNMDQTTWYYADIQEATNSHEYYMTTSEQGEEYEIWTELLPMRDWPALEKEWSDANSSTGADVTR